MKSKKWIALVLGMTMTAVALIGCGNADTGVAAESNADTVVESKESSEATVASETTTEVEEVKDYSDVTFRIAWWGNDTRAENTIKIIEEFEKQYPGLTVEVEYCAYNDYFTKLSTQAVGNDLPDVIQMDAIAFATWAASNQLLPLDTYFEDGSIDLTNVPDSVIDSCKYNGIAYGMSTGSSAHALIYNPAVLEELGLSISKSPTVSEFNEVCKKVYEATGMKSWQPNFEVLFRSMGGDMSASEGAALGFDADMLYKVWSNSLKGYKEGYLLADDDYKAADTASQLAEKVTWCVGQYSSFINSYEKGSGLSLELMCYPVADDAVEPNATAIKPNTYWSANAKTEHPELAVAFMDFFTNTEYVYEVCGTDRGIPVSSEMRAFLAKDADAVTKKAIEYIDFLSDGHSTPLNMNAPAGADEVLSEYYIAEEVIRRKMIDESELQEYCQTTIEKLSKVFDNYK